MILLLFKKPINKKKNSFPDMLREVNLPGKVRICLFRELDYPMIILLSILMIILPERSDLEIINQCRISRGFQNLRVGDRVSGIV